MQSPFPTLDELRRTDIPVRAERSTGVPARAEPSRSTDNPVRAPLLERDAQATARANLTELADALSKQPSCSKPPT
ncbi:MAG: hypothetical protein ACK4RG_05410, partial [Fimbriimonadales bacterium]